MPGWSLVCRFLFCTTYIPLGVMRCFSPRQRVLGTDELRDHTMVELWDAAKRG